MTGWIAAITRGHNAGVALFKDGELVFAAEEERYSRAKYDGAPLVAMTKILDYTPKIDWLVVAHTQLMTKDSGRLEYSIEPIYQGWARKLGLIEYYPKMDNSKESHPQVIDYGTIHHKLHASCNIN